MSARSAGVMPYRLVDDRVQVLLVHPGGPFWVSKDDGVWSIAKGEYEDPEVPFDAAMREFEEETGVAVDGSAATPLGEVTQRAGKLVTAWALPLEFDPATLVSNTFTIEWPRGSGKMLEIPEVDRAEWFYIDAARIKINPAQTPFLDRLLELLRRDT